MRVVHCKKEPYTHYIGRPGPWGNPFSHLGKSLAQFRVYSREEAIQKYEEYARNQPGLLVMIKALPEDAVLGCWCKPDSCHGDIIVKLWRELHGR